MGHLTDIIFYLNKLSVQNIIEGYKNIMNVPNVNEYVMVNDNCYKVVERLFDFDSNTVHITVETVKRHFAR